MKLICIIPLILLSLATPQVEAQVSQPVTHSVANTQNLLAELNFPNNGTPSGRRKGGGSRDGCPSLSKSITALVPGEETNNTSFLASTVAEYPTIWIYVPELPTNLNSGEFLFQDEQGNNIWRTAIALPRKAGAIGISLPPHPQFALKINKKYQWYFKVYCGAAQKTSDYFYVNASLQRVALTPDMENRLKTAKVREYVVYTNNHIWYDAVTNLADMRRVDPASHVLVEDWTKLLKAVGLAEFAQEPILGRYGSER
ncbi:MAG: DUF928 domain-containing protein [Stigonema ocellatum SAG 48.90 = DSM 106950]|nr:DUF928 domain-containing protein [Stigonema ocellatum SAG 48.90 = DSM 106950]